MRRSLSLVSLCAVALALAGCGNKGPLYMPAKPATPAAAPAKPAAPAPATSTVKPASASSSL
ncbi:lipoprotein [Dyella sp. GSA-30]|uniref:LPS translocon maturation chaperone LptM n=1 Tax=Dyella sp. GSA-30 TaxID=2994496 RepID=UPI002492E151|nr:lipoprotein [Dyella sp. GSA-30]